MTNGDKFRAMSDRELAELLYGFYWNGDKCYECPLFDKDCAGITGLENWHEWIGKPVEDDDETY